MVLTKGDFVWKDWKAGIGFEFFQIYLLSQLWLYIFFLFMTSHMFCFFIHLYAYFLIGLQCWTKHSPWCFSWYFISKPPFCYWSWNISCSADDGEYITMCIEPTEMLRPINDWNKKCPAELDELTNWVIYLLIQRQ